MLSRISLLLLVYCISPAAAEEAWRSSWDATLYGYAGHMALREDSVLNPGNQIARMAQSSDTAELRMNARAEREALRFTARGIASKREQRNGFGAQSNHDAYLSQWQVRVRAAEGWHLAAGRDVLNWGAAQFRSPSSPFYFDNGRSDPMRELTGMDMLKLSWTPDRALSANLMRIVRAGDEQAQGTVWRDSWLLKMDLRGDDWAYGLVAVHAPHLPGFYAAHGQWTVSDAAMLYGELSSSVRRDALQSPEDAALPFTVQTQSPRRSTASIGAAYTFDNGQTLNAEYLHDGHGYSAAQQESYFARAATAPVLAGLALGLAPRLLGRDYLHLVWQSNLMESEGYWRLMATRNLTDHSGSLSGYGEHTLSTRISAFVVGQYAFGDARQEAGALFTRSLTLGLKVALP
ncbi:MAG: hypothetical protein KKF58_02715 [Gammaproteobacteria bacterium]|nr:hypothetical protein [Gammaproteobacteria bacterium]MBU1447201.1 hypothetical protein [Gammaproteobacteria bacterium]